MIVNIPKVGQVEFPDTMSQEEINAAAKKLYDEANAPQKGTLQRTAEITARGAYPPAAMATAGALMGAPAGPIGSAVGALTGGLAIPVSDVLVNLYNLSTRSDVKLPSAAISDLLDNLGLAKPESRGERMLEAGAGALTGVGSQLPALTRLATGAVSPVTRGVAQQAAQAPVAQTTLSVPSAATAQYVTEATGSPLAGLVAGTAVGAAGGVRPGRVEQGLERSEIAAQATQAYRLANRAGLEVKPEFLDDVYQKMLARLSSRAEEPLGYSPKQHRELADALSEIKTSIDAGNPLTLSELDNLRQILKSPASAFGNPKQQMITSELIDIFDESLLNLNQKNVISGDAKLATSALENARKLYSTQKKLQTIEDLVNKASISAGGYSQSGMDNALRVQFAGLARNNKRMAQFSKTERAEIERIAKGGGTTEQIMRFIGKFAVRGPVTGAVQTVLPGGGVESILASEAAKRSAEAMRQQNVQRLMETISLGRTPEGRAFELLPASALRGLLSSQYGME